MDPCAPGDNPRVHNLESKVNLRPCVKPRADPRVVEPGVKVRLEDNIEKPDEDLAYKASTTSAM